MVESSTVVKNKTGLHARPASQLVKLCKTFESDIILKNGDISCNGKSMFSVLKKIQEMGVFIAAKRRRGR